MQSGVVVIGIGEIGAVIARGFLRLGLPVFPVVRAASMAQCARDWPLPMVVVVATGEAELPAVLQSLPLTWRDRIVLLQNELLPRDWAAAALTQPTVVSLWFEKKKGQDVKVLLSSPVWGPHGELVVQALTALGIPAHRVTDASDMLYELVRKNVYILTTNIAGLVCGGDVTYLWTQHRALAERVANEIMDVQAYLSASALDRVQLLRGLEEGIQGDPRHGCQGRSAPQRLIRLLRYADEAHLAVPTLREIHATCVLKKVEGIK
ncbi:MAG: hypothetical protein OEW08_12335 [Gammaproteobacteria bacterium]|nr:hypothetical protein [Gammaproteobacteria bacterium]